VADPALGFGNARSRAGLLSMCELVSRAAQEADTRAPRELVRDILEDSGLREFYGAAGTPESVSAVENLFEVINAASSYEDGQLREFVEASTIEAVAADTGEKDLLTIATLHGAKGLEWRGVYLGGFEDGLLPYGRALSEEGGEDEERRLAYVGITRAKALLTLTIVSSRFLNGERISQRVSRFLDRAGKYYSLADHTSPDGGMAARMAASGRATFGARPGGFAARPTAGFGSRRPGTAPSGFPRRP
jgi:DNA helicase-2/ATP-dependent DNA helicase PcrA